MLCQCIQWFNPFVYILADSLHEVHEYEVDAALVAQGIDQRDYQSLLIGKATGRVFHGGLACRFRQGSLRRRLGMMQHTGSSPWRRLKTAMLLPPAVCAIVALARPAATAPSTT